MVSQSGINRLEIANSAQLLANKLNSEESQKQLQQTEQGQVDPAAQFTNQFGRDAFAKVSLADRAMQIKGLFPNQPNLNRDQLISEGYNPNVVKQAIPLGGIPGVAENVTNFFTNLFGG